MDNPAIRELLCMLCGCDYSVWYAPNPLWNKVMRHPDGREASEKYHFVCPNCFIKQAEAIGGTPTVWELRDGNR